jgi:hypothetical protein
MKAASQKEGFTPLQKAKSMGAPPLPPSGRAPTIEEMLEWTNLRELPKAVDLQPLYDLVDMREEIYISRLREAVGIKGVSAWVDHRPKIVEMIEWTKAWAEKLGCSEARLVENPKKGEDDTLPPMLLVTFDCETQVPNEQARAGVERTKGGHPTHPPRRSARSAPTATSTCSPRKKPTAGTRSPSSSRRRTTAGSAAAARPTTRARRCPGSGPSRRTGSWASSCPCA